ncbi:MAG: SoxR reducing system RseC family protein [Phycisphaerae bacterium]|nr:SoxR reducing system RseC family protein [Phycisphaerae bacterium]
MSFLENMRFGCEHCLQRGRCPATCDAPESGEDTPIDSGPSLVLPSITVFLMPLASGIVGAFLADRWAGSAVWQGVGLLAGLAAGVIVARMLIARWWRPQACPLGDEA